MVETKEYEKKYYQSCALADRINWEYLMPLSRCAGGHDEHMQGLLKDITILGHFNDGDYQGHVATCVQLNDTREVVIYNDSYGSCSGCDAWEDSTDDEVKDMCRQLACGAYVFKNLKDCIEFLENPDKGTSFDWAYEDLSQNLLKEIDREKYVQFESNEVKQRLFDLDIVMEHDIINGGKEHGKKH